MSAKLSGGVFKFLNNDIVSETDGEMMSSPKLLKPINLPFGHKYVGQFFCGYINIHGQSGEKLMEVILGFIFDVSKYVETLRKHGVRLKPEAEKLFHNI
jgi:hypothetical protein